MQEKASWMTTIGARVTERWNNCSELETGGLRQIIENIGEDKGKGLIRKRKDP